ncbi:glycosyltransferase family 2 protein [Fulvimarina endophytica]|uniref:Glycosyltransferase family 2 protein n=1 Tax=Fulvimarina endophytica TaxID=2293836 RepID=A0A371X3C1_9HYPH|nr:glycosyltransferase family 2 protein [Fulvimarina endophytica]RFC63727.1 glycosyltransferase family 2 protein [Fulvimarina endophytica]
MIVSSTRTVSVIVPSFGHQDFIQEALSSIYNQTYHDIEIVFIDDCSSDQTFERGAALLKSSDFVRRFKRIHVERNETNMGAHATINKGIAVSRGDYIAIINSDDRYHADRLSRLIDGMTASSSEFGFSLVKPFSNESTQDFPDNIRMIGVNQLLALERDPTVGFSLLRGNQAISTGNFVFTRRLYELVGPFLPLRYCHDWDFALQALYFTEPYVAKDALYEYRLHGSNSFSGLQHVAEVETEAVIRRFLQSAARGNAPNLLAPTATNWPGLFEIFIRECGFERFYAIENGLGMSSWRIYD